MDEPELVMQILERFSKLKQNDRDIPRELEEYITFVARTGDSVYHWYGKLQLFYAMTKASFISQSNSIYRALVKHLFREKLINVITQFYNDSPNIKELPQYPNVDAFNFETMKKMLIEKLDSFNSAPFTIQRICELLADPRKQYSRIDKFMRAVEKTILVVSTQEPGRHRSESENGDSLDSALNGDFASEVNVEIDMDSENSFSTKDFSATATANRKDTNNEVTTTTTKPTTALATDVTVATVKEPETNGSSVKTTDAVPKTDSEEVKSEPATEATPPAEVPPVTETAPASEVTPPAEAAPATEAPAPASEVVPAVEVAPVAEVTSVTASGESKPSSSNSDTEVKKDEDKSPVEEKAEEKPVVEAEEVRVEVAEEEEPESIEEELPEEAEEDEEDDEDDDDDDIANVGLEDDEDDEDEEEEDKSQDSMSTSDAIPSTTEALEPIVAVNANPMNEEVPIECAEAVAVAVAPLPSSSSIVLEMEASSSAAPSSAVESKMSLDEDATSEITEESAPVVPINKMDTETEGDAMDVDESEATSEPMDQ
ncbi:unnamed protein product [Diamesa hyperborea]